METTFQREVDADTPLSSFFLSPPCKNPLQPPVKMLYTLYNCSELSLGWVLTRLTLSYQAPHLSFSTGTLFDMMMCVTFERSIAHIFLDPKSHLYYPVKEDLTMKRKMFGTIASFMFIAFLGAFPKMGFAQEGKWTKKAVMPTPRGGLSTSVVNGKIYAIGGLGGGNNVLSTVEEYDPKTDKWTKKADMPTARLWLSTSAVNEKIYAIGGWDGGGRFFSAVEEYDPKTDKWMKKADMPTARGGLSTSVVNGKIYAIGGWKGMPFSEEYDPKTDTWTKKANMPTGRSRFATGVVNGKIYAIGGIGPEFNGLSTVEAYDPAADT